jgi:AmmeMemoRadiSam system protein A
MHPLVQLAQHTIELYVRQKRTPDAPAALPEDLPDRAGAFVSIHTHGRLRGCIGTIEPSQDSLALEVIQNAVSAATRDPRFPAITVQELADLDIKVDVLGEPEPVQSLDDLDPKRYGVIVQSQRQPWKRGLLLPDLEGVDTVAHQLEIARRKAWLSPDEAVQIYRFSVDRYT